MFAVELIIYSLSEPELFCQRYKMHSKTSFNRIWSSDHRLPFYDVPCHLFHIEEKVELFYHRHIKAANIRL